MKKITVGVIVMAVLFLCEIPAFAADSCSNWLAQGNGVEWRQCVRDNGTRFCQERRGNNISNVTC